MIVIPGRGETAETALAHANAASGGQFAGNAAMAPVVGVAPEAGRAASGTGAAGTGYAPQPAGTMVVTTVPPPAAVGPAPAPAPRPVYAAARANAGYGAPRAADPTAIATVVAGTAEPASNPVRPARSRPSPHACGRPRRVGVAGAARDAGSANPAPAANPTMPPSPRRRPASRIPSRSAARPSRSCSSRSRACRQTTATVTTAFPRGLAACTTLEPFMPTGRACGAARRSACAARASGRGPSTCRRKSRTGHYYVAARQIAPGEPLSAADLVARDGDLTVLPLAVITDPAQAIGSTALARSRPGCRCAGPAEERGVGVGGQTVRVVAAGPGFTISAEGSALANAAPASRSGCGWRRARSSRRSSRTPARGDSAVGTDPAAECKELFIRSISGSRC
nr:flagella basal body P-ring formation protein FlgA [Burkholderia cepacia]